ncbi:probable E3 ubiquitin-protein ligase HERC4 isoform X2 [Lineus longissimus]|uniref:probable E3 ubiquitin-protein ligase HERC4 isoform X2 n=1 Tax=Lineus longissimus TaxID=88925 RepID=UPI002B4F67C5
MPTLLGWGSVEYGQLGVGGIEENAIFVPEVSANLQNEVWQAVSCGYRHTIFVAKNGEIYSCGNNVHGQLGQTLSEKKPERVSFPTSKSMSVTQLCSGASHNLAVTADGELYCWGSNEYGQLGLGNPKQIFSQPVPRLLEFPDRIKVIQVACGDSHSMALTDVGGILVWGHNKFNQLGLGSRDNFNHKPEILCSLHGLPIRQIACGGNHSFALTQSGAVFGWGRNFFGQLGVGHDRECQHPVLCRSLRSQKVKHIACGENHTAVLTKDGGVFTFGAGMYGQLGHSSKNNETLPRKVFELMGNKVTQISCGRCHTLALVGTSGRLFSFGTGSSGQLGTGKDSTNGTSPVSVRGDWVPYNEHPPMEVSKSSNLTESSYVINKIFTGGNHCFIIASRPEERIEPTDFREIIPKQQVLTISRELVQQVSKLNSTDPPSEPFLALIEKVFSSPACLNASFLLGDDQHYNCSSRQSGVDIEAALQTFSSISLAGNAVLNQRIYACLERLLQQLKSSPPDVEALRLYLTIPQCRLFDNPINNNSLVVRFGEAVLRLAGNAGKVIDSWWSKLEEQHFRRLVDIHKKLVNYFLDPQRVFSENVRPLYSTMEMLKKLNEVNVRKCQIVPYDHFYIPEVKDRINIQNDYIHWIRSQHNIDHNQNVLIFCNYPFALDAQAKTILLQTDAHIQMRTAVEEVAQRNLATLTFAGFLPMVDVINPCLVLHIQRNNLLNDTITQLTKYGNADLKKPLKVTFADEEALDAGGVRKEFFMLLMREILDPQYGMFKYYEESRLIWFRQQLADDDRYMFMLVGQVCGLAIYNSTIIDLSFPLALYKKLLQKPVTLEDMKELEPQLGRGLEEMMEYDDEDFEDIFPITFEIDCDIYGHLEKTPLVDNGANIKVTNDNKQEFVDAYVNYVFNKSVKTQFENFNAGFQKVIGSRVLEFFHPKELQAMVVGNENYDFGELERNCQYKGAYYASHHTVKFFWEVFHSMSLEDKKKFLLFLTGSDRIPILGMKALSMIIQPTLGGETYLPVAHTCFNLLDLPIYNSKVVLQEKLLKAIQQTEGFGIV